MNQDKTYLAIYLIHFLFNDFILLIANFLVDIFLVKNMRSLLKKKKEFNRKIYHESNKKNQEALSNLKEIKSSEKSTNKMLIYSFVTFFFCRFPELCVYLYLATPFYNQTIIYNFAPMLINIIHYLYILSYSTNLFFYKKFNHYFRDAFYRAFSSSFN